MAIALHGAKSTMTWSAISASFALARSKKQTMLVVAHGVVAALVAFVAFWKIGTADVAPDEYVYRTCAHAYVLGNFTCNLEHPLLAKEILGIFESAFGASIDVARATTAVFVCATALFCYLFVTDCTDRYGGLLAACAWGLLPQAGIEGGTTIEAIRIDRFGLLDPFVACFVAVALWTGWRWAQRGGTIWAACTAAACVAAACAKAPGILIVPVVCGVPLWTRRKSGRVLREVAAALVGGAVVLLASYAPLGLGQARDAIAYMFNAQTSHVNGGSLVAVAGHLYIHVPWWSDISFALSGLTWPIAVVLAIAALIGLFTRFSPAAYALGASACILIGVGAGLHLSLPHYWIDWVLGVIVAASLGLRRVLSTKALVPLGLACAIVLAAGVVWTLRDVVTLGRGPYQGVAKKASCHTPCVVQFAGYNDVLINYVPHGEILGLGPPRVRDGAVQTPLRDGTTLDRVRPQLVVIDPAALDLHTRWTQVAHFFEAHAASLGYVRLESTGRIEVWASRR